MLYDHKKIEKKWQAEWQKNKIYTTPDEAPGKDNFYLLVEFPYPSGNLHVGHWYSFAVPDIFARYMRMRGKNVLYPIGFDAFGLPAENAAIKNKLNPRDWTEKNIAYMTTQIESMGTMFDWSRKVSTIDPAYYKWTQWQFLQFYKKGLVYRKETAVNWCPKDKTVLANEQVVEGKCERCDTEVVQRQMLQWNIKITDYADRLLEDLEPLDWPKEIKESQKNWIGRSEGAEIDFALNIDANIKRFVILHAKGATPDTDFYPWLKVKLEARGYEVQVPQLPNPESPDDEEQTDYAMKHCTFDEQTAVIGHSFGCIVALRLLERGVKLGRVILVGAGYSGEFVDGKARPTVTAALKKGFDAEKVKKNAGGFIVLHDINDPVIPPSDPEILAEKLGTLLMRVKANAGHFNSAKEEDVLMAAVPTVRVFTTRPDTLFGATYLVLAPEHPWVTLALEHKTVLSNNDEVQTYVDRTKKMSDLERQTNKEKTGVQLKGVQAVNPATSEKIPLYTADYVLPQYGTGAIMAVPAHDERDFEFAKKFGLPIRQVVAPVMTSTKPRVDAVRENVPFKDRDAVMCIVKHWEKDEYLCIQWRDYDVHTFLSGGIEQGETPEQTGAREITEETGFLHPEYVRQVGGISVVEFYHRAKETNVRAKFHYFYFELNDGERIETADEEQKKHEVVWKRPDELLTYLTILEKERLWRMFNAGDSAYVGNGMLVNSGIYDGMTTAEAAKVMMTAFGRARKTYKLRDWIVSRQRYWGVPIPMLHCAECGIVPVPESELPVLLPDVDDYLPSGEGRSPLAKVPSFVNVKCPQCGGNAERETDTLDTFVDSSWYFLRYTDPKNSTQFAESSKQENWMPIDLYSGGAEHTTMHVLYSRFWHKALFDLGLVADKEPYTRRMNRGIILGPDGQKMSKSHGNVVDPDEIVARLGSDTVRMYLAFIGPYNEVASYPWNPNGVVGVRRFLERVARAEEHVTAEDAPALQTPLHKALKKVGEDAQALKFNTAISQLMILLNAIEKEKAVGAAQWRHFILMLAPFAPHLAEQLWNNSREERSVHLEQWPEFDEKFLREERITIAIQIDGKTRDEVTVPSGADMAATESAARDAVAAKLGGQEVARVVVVPGRLVNFVLKH